MPGREQYNKGCLIKWHKIALTAILVLITSSSCDQKIQKSDIQSEVKFESISGSSSNSEEKNSNKKDESRDTSNLKEKESHSVVKNASVTSLANIKWKKMEAIRNATFIYPEGFEDMSPEIPAAGECYIYYDKASDITLQIGIVPAGLTPSGVASVHMRECYQAFIDSATVDSYYKNGDKEYYIKGITNDNSTCMIEWTRSFGYNLYSAYVDYPADCSDNAQYEMVAETFLNGFVIDGWESVPADDCSTQKESIVDICEYLTTYHELVDVLDMKQTPPWQMGGDSYEINGFYLEYLDDPIESIFSMKNESANGITLYGISIGDNCSDAKGIMTANGWDFLFDNNGVTGFMKDANEYMVEFNHDSNDVITMWYLNNWPQGDY